MKTLVVLAALAAVALAGPTFRAGDTDLDITKIKRSPTLHQHHIATPVHVTPIHHTFVQPVIPHHLGLKKPLLIKKPYGHHLFRSDDEQLETHSAESKESKTKCMKEMEAKCEDDVIAKSSELQETKIEDIEGNVPDRNVAQSLQMAQEAVDMLRKNLELSHKNSKSMSVPFKHEESEADRRMHADLEAAKLALERMQFNMGNLESMNVHARQFKNAEVHDVNLELKSDEERLAQWKDAIENIQKNVELVRNIEDSFQNNDHSEKSAALEKSSSLKHEMTEDHKLDSIHNEHSEKSAVLEKSSSLKHEMSEDHKLDATHQGISEKSAALEKSSSFTHEMVEDHKLDAMHQGISEKSAALEKSSSLKHEMIEDHKLNAMHNGQSVKSAALDTTTSFKHEINNGQKHDALELNKEKTADTMMARDMENKSTDKKTSWQAREPEKSSKSEMETSASTLSESKTFLHSPNEPKSFRSETTHSEMSSDIPIASKLTAEHVNVKGIKNDERSVKITEDKKISKLMEPVSEPSLKSSENLNMKSSFSEQGKMAPVVDTTSFMKSAERNPAEQHSKNLQHGSEGHLSHMEHGMSSHSSFEHSSQKEPEMRSHQDHTTLRGQNAHEIHQQLDHQKAKESEPLKQHELSNSAMHSKAAHEMMMKSSDQMPSQSQQSGLAIKAEHVTGHHSENLHHTSNGAHGKSAEDGLFTPIEMPAFKQSLVPSNGGKSWKELQSARGAYGSGLALGGSYGAGYGSGSGAVGVFPKAHVGGCAIPLLLSCSPSVVTGSLAKSHGYAAPSYGASGYRSDSNTHSKRDITKISRPYIKRTPNKDLKQKAILISGKLQ